MNSNYFESVFEELCQNLKGHNNLKKVSEEFIKNTSDCDRIRYLLQLDPIQCIVQLPEGYSAIEKSREISQRLRDDGNMLFKSKKYFDSVRLYTDSLSWAPLPSNSDSDNSASLAFANRSASLYQLSEYELCMADINRALDASYPNALSYKLYDRRGQSQQAIGRVDDAIISYNNAKERLDVSELNRSRRQQLSDDIDRRIITCKTANTAFHATAGDTVERDKVVPQLRDGKSTNYPCLSAACSVTYAPGRGRFIVANCDVFPGDVILVERPYAAILLSDGRLDHCDQCYSPTIAPIPCVACHHALYCGDECRQAAWSSYHQIECRLRSLLSMSGVDKFALLAVRTVIVSTYSKVLTQALRSSSIDLSSAVDDGGSADGYHGICTLVTHSQHRSAHDLFRRSVIAIFLVRCLEFAGYYGCDKSTQEEGLVATGGMLLNHLQSFPCNAHEISEFDLVIEDVPSSVPHELGAGIYATLSLFNHSCNPAVTRNFYGDTCVVRAIRSVGKGEELSDNYGAVYAIQSCDERRNKLKPQYFFECCCEACVDDWPMFMNSHTLGPRWRCSKCQRELKRDSRQCPACSSIVDVDSSMKQLRTSHSLYKKAFDQLLACHIGEALTAMLSHLCVMDRLLCLPWSEYSACQEAVKQCYSIMANCRIINHRNNIETNNGHAS